MKKLLILLIFCFCIILTVGCVSKITSENSTKYTVNPSSVTLTPTMNYDAREAFQSANDVSVLMDNIIGTTVSYDNSFISHLNEYIAETQKGQYNFPLLLNNFQTDLDNLDRIQPELNDLNTKITKFSGDTVRWHGDTRTYAEQAASQMRIIYNDFNDAISNEREMITYIKLYINSAKDGRPNQDYYSKYSINVEKMNKSRVQINKDRDILRDTLKKIEQLQNQ